ncbi:UNVERIFIED_CONTAM: Transposon Tf2-11 polyprotein [Sesamum radiatum]|uniref:Transposon Tf2-11 polyprotein n=1 Tax=Sesamum radiatum TaxID=300843 RepID=A0AAW2MZ01_SESRA
MKKVLDDNKPFTKAESHFTIEDVKKGKEKPSKPLLKGFVPSTQEDEGRHEALAIDEKGFDLKAFKLIFKAGYKPKEFLNLGKLPPEATGKKLDGLNATQMMLKEKGHAIQDSRVGLGFTPPTLVHIAIKLGPCKRMGYQKKSALKVAIRLKKNIKFSHTQKLRSLIPSRMRRQTTLTVSCGRVLKVKAQTMIFTQVQSDDNDDKESVTSSYYISNGAEVDIAQTYHITLIEDGEVEEEGAGDAPVELEEGIKATIDELKEVNLGNIEYPRPIYISASLTQEEDETYIALLHEFKDVFARSYKEMPRLAPKHRPYKKEEWANSTLSFMDGSSRYNQIYMAPTDEELMAFRTPKGIYCYKVMPFRLNNAGATYQKAMQRIFDDMLHKNVECYIDNLVVTPKKQEDHFHALRKVKAFRLKVKTLQKLVDDLSGIVEGQVIFMAENVSILTDAVNLKFSGMKTKVNLLKRVVGREEDHAPSSKDDKLFNFLPGFQTLAQKKLRRHGVKNLPSVIGTAKQIVDFKITSDVDPNKKKKESGKDKGNVSKAGKDGKFK